VQDFYAEIQVEHRRRAATALAARDLGARLSGVLHAGVDTMTPYHGFAASFIKVAIEPGSPLSPFSAESKPARDDAIGLFADALGGAGTGVDPRLRAELPRLLWLGYLGVTLFWVHDGSPGQARTRALIDHATPLVPRLLRLARLPVARSTVRHLLDLTTLLGEPA
jgi:Tetracyclin repressor-like, C-terminal domain